MHQTSVDFIKSTMTKHYKPMTREEVHQCALTIQKGLEVLEFLGYKRTFKGVPKEVVEKHPIVYRAYKAREKFIISHMPFAFKHCNKFSKGSTQKLEELLQEAFGSLGRAAELFNPKSGFASTTFVAYWLLQSSLSYLRQSSSSFKISAAIYALRNKINKEQLKAKEQGLPMPSHKILARMFDTTEENITKALGIFIEVSGDETESDGSADDNATKFELIASPENAKEESMQHYSDIITSRLPVKNSLGFTLMADIISDLKDKVPLTLEQEYRIEDYLKTAV